MNIIWIRIISWNDRNNTEYKRNDRNNRITLNDRNNTEYKRNDIIMLNNRKAEELS